MRKHVALPLLLLATLSCASLILMRPTASPWEPPNKSATRAETPSERLACLDRNPLRQAFFGDLHVHTQYSMDARSRDMLGSPDDALRFARGESIGLGPFDENSVGTRQAQLDRPLDFAAVTDHAEWIGEVTLCTTPGSDSYETQACQSYRGEAELKTGLASFAKGGRLTAVIGALDRLEDICGPNAERCRASLRSAWETTQLATERWNDDSNACSFTAFHGWEHSYSVNMSKVHRNVIFRNDRVPELPISSLEAPDAVDLWDQLDELCTESGSGCEVLTIPHNSNVSNGRLFEITWQRESREEQVRQASVRARMDRLVEIMQVKGESECQNGLFDVVGEEDELCSFEKIRDMASSPPDDCEEDIGSGAIRGSGCQSRVDFARYALVEGLREEERIGVNPFQFGMIGSTDGHNANPGDVEEHGWQGCCAGTDVTAEARLSMEPSFGGAGKIGRNPGGLMGVWAEENSRDSLFDAMQRRETFATSGPRIKPRFFGGWDFDPDLCEQDGLVAAGYENGVAMGSVLPNAKTPGRAPVFVAQVSRDPGVEDHPGGLLDRLQVIKVWHGEDGQFHQSVYDIGGRMTEGEESDAATPSVDLNTCTPRGAGHDSLCAVWTDPEFDAARSAAYYVRAVENPSCRWSWQTCLSIIPEADRPEGCRDDSIPKVIQERAWSSPIWYEPAGTS